MVDPDDVMTDERVDERVRTIRHQVMDRDEGRID